MAVVVSQVPKETFSNHPPAHSLGTGGSTASGIALSDMTVTRTVIKAFVRMVVCRNITVQRVTLADGRVLESHTSHEEDDPVILHVSHQESSDPESSITDRHQTLDASGHSNHKPASCGFMTAKADNTEVESCGESSHSGPTLTSKRGCSQPQKNKVETVADSEISRSEDSHAPESDRQTTGSSGQGNCLDIDSDNTGAVSCNTEANFLVKTEPESAVTLNENKTVIDSDHVDDDHVGTVFADAQSFNPDGLDTDKAIHDRDTASESYHRSVQNTRDPHSRIMGSFCASPLANKFFSENNLLVSGNAEELDPDASEPDGVEDTVEVPYREGENQESTQASQANSLYTQTSSAVNFTEITPHRRKRRKPEIIRKAMEQNDFSTTIAHRHITDDPDSDQEISTVTSLASEENTSEPYRASSRLDPYFHLFECSFPPLNQMIKATESSRERRTNVSARFVHQSLGNTSVVSPISAHSFHSGLSSPKHSRISRESIYARTSEQSKHNKHGSSTMVPSSLASGSLQKQRNFSEGNSSVSADCQVQVKQEVDDDDCTVTAAYDYRRAGASTSSTRSQLLVNRTAASSRMSRGNISHEPSERHAALDDHFRGLQTDVEAMHSAVSRQPSTLGSGYLDIERALHYPTAFSAQLHLSEHFRRYKCHICSKAFKRKSHLDVHLKFHMDVRSYRCEECHQSYVQKGDLMRHLRSSAHRSSTTRASK